MVPSMTIKVMKRCRKRDLQAALIGSEQAVEAALGQPVEPSVLLAALVLEQARAHHRRQRERDHERENERQR